MGFCGTNVEEGKTGGNSSSLRDMLFLYSSMPCRMSPDTFFFNVSSNRRCISSLCSWALLCSSSFIFWSSTILRSSSASFCFFASRSSVWCCCNYSYQHGREFCHTFSCKSCICIKKSTPAGSGAYLNQ